jgi:RimJ/RimL family protein N-acetyltransferase
MIHGQLTILRAIEREDLDAIWRWNNDSAVMYFWTEPYKVMSRAELDDRYDSLSGPGGHSHWLLITVRDEDEPDRPGEPIGRIGYVELDRRHRHAEIALMIGERAYWSRGYGTDAVTAYLAYLFHEFNLHKVYLRVEEYNARAQRAYEKCGFRRDGVFRDHTFLGGRYYDSIIMSITEDEYRERHPFVPPV